MLVLDIKFLAGLVNQEQEKLKNELIIIEGKIYLEKKEIPLKSYKEKADFIREKLDQCRRTTSELTEL